MGIIYDILDKVIPKVQEREALEGGDWKVLLREELKKIGCSPTDQSKGDNQNENNQLKYSTREKFKQTIRKL
ncbi:MAG: hypothetical protein E7I47_16395 [Clostridium sp.]|uniref:hypothetical protein n=1 Tax=Clostridium sp. TaxID=1506 RepID=UPI00290D2DDB|nr:hypothetical protein [Clostridium sp.]MDU4320875.1 hypothetical protein [Clostridium sp.]